MKTLNTMFLAITFVTVTTFWGCNEEENENPPTALTQHDTISECGGFRTAFDPIDPGPDGGYCEAELLQWEYSAGSGTLQVTDSRMLLNCCGDHGMEAELVDGVMVITETDAPEGGMGRCDCMCVFDFSITIEGVAASELTVRLERHVTDTTSGPELIWEGTLDLAAGAGEALISDEDLGMWCENPEPEPEFSSDDDISDCGGFPENREPETDGPGDYCAAEMLYWEYEAATGELTLEDTRIVLNCCGDHSMDMELVEGVYVVTETDDADAAGRCDCECVYDFGLVTLAIPNEVIDLRIERVWTDGGSMTVWSGSLDLTTGSGEVTIDDTPVDYPCAM